MDFFSRIPGDFFLLLSSKNKEIYLSCLLVVFDAYEKGRIIGIERSLAVDLLEEHLTFYKQDLDMSDDEPQIIIDDISNETEEDKIRDKATFVLRKMIKYGWIQTDIMPDLTEYLNFPDYAITFLSAIKQIIREEELNDSIDPTQYHGYIYTIYSLLMNSGEVDYGLTLDTVYKNTILFYRELRKIDYKLKNYIRSIVDHSEIKDLIETLIKHKEEILDRSYLKLKTSENVSKYKLAIISKLREYQDTPLILNMIANYNLPEYAFDYEKAYRASEDKINEVIDIFTSFEEIMKEIDDKNRNYINSSIGKIKFLLSNDTNVLGQLNYILKFVKKSNEKKRIDMAINKIRPLFSMHMNKFLNNDSLFTPRGNYQHQNTLDVLLNDDFDISEIERKFYLEYSSKFTEDQILEFVDKKMQDKKVLKVSEVLGKNANEDDLLRFLYAIIYSDENSQYKINILDDKVDLENFKMNEFEIIRREN